MDNDTDIADLRRDLNALEDDINRRVARGEDRILALEARQQPPRFTAQEAAMLTGMAWDGDA